MNEQYHTIPECGWPCRLSPENENNIDLNDGTSVCLSSNRAAYIWYDIDGGIMENFLRGSEDFAAWEAVHFKLRELETAT